MKGFQVIIEVEVKFFFYYHYIQIKKMLSSHQSILGSSIISVIIIFSSLDICHQYFLFEYWTKFKFSSFEIPNFKDLDARRDKASFKFE